MLHFGLNIDFASELPSLAVNAFLRIIVVVAAAFVGATELRAADGKIAVVAAENFYGDVAQQIGGGRVSVTSILSNPLQDPHLFEASPAVLREIAAAQIVVYNGADYDPWMDKVLAATPKRGRSVIVAADLVGKRAGENPHLWYDPLTMPAVAKALAASFAAADPAHNDDYAARLRGFLASLEPLQQKIAAIRGKYAGTPVTATEPVFGYMAAALNLKMNNGRFQIAVMNGTEPAARDIAAFEQDLRAHKVRVMFYNKQAPEKLVQRLVDEARASAIPVVGVTEICPPGLSYQQWLLNELDETEKALAGPSS
jgi:zinc/manganese transport system substrate-binding protein